MKTARISLNGLQAFATAARHLSFTRAAEELCVTQAAVSHLIKTLETQVGRPLFHRTARGLQLTDDGARLAPAVQQAVAQLWRARRCCARTGPVIGRPGRGRRDARRWTRAARSSTRRC